MGNTLIVGSLKTFRNKTEKQEQWQQIKARLDKTLLDQIDEKVFPGSRGQTIIRALMMIGELFSTGVKEFRKLEVKVRDPEATKESLIYASASKPFHQRVRDAKIASWATAFKTSSF